MDADPIPAPTPRDAEKAVGGECAQHGIEGVAQTTDCTDIDLIDAVDPVEGECVIDGIKRVCSDGEIIGEKHDERGSRQPCDERHAHCPARREAKAYAKPCTYTHEVMCAEVLPDEAGERDAECKEWIIEEALDACIDGHASHCCIAEGVDVRLDDEGGKAHEDSLESGGNACAEDGQEMPRGEEWAAEAQLPCAAEMEKFPQGEQCCCTLRDDGRGCCTCNTARDDDEKHDVECYVEHDGDGEVVESARCIAERSQDGARCIVEKLCEYTIERSSQIKACCRDEFGWRGECREQLLGQDDARRCKKCGEQYDGDENAPHERTETSISLFSVEVGDEDAKSGREADEEIDDDGENETCRSHGGK